ncbi:MAG: N-acetylmuramoyl-L-alanine amidase, partial [Oscillospiraceae bacterium]|nr:N-acetylmuramoyl-L-alanine amidase [Oscillospiraceae bacterium]
YFSESGVMETGWIDFEQGRMYFDENGKQKIGLQEIENQVYYFDTNGMMQTGLVNTNSGNYYFSESGVMETGWIDFEQGRMYFDENGKQKTNWQEIEEQVYYFDSNGIMQTGLVQIDDKTYRFQTDGIYQPLKICLDAGHYGSLYNRSPVNKAYYESNFTWDMHLYLKTALENYGFEVITTRETKDDNPALELRGEMSAGCVLFLSLHSNACGSSSIDAPLACCQVSGKADVLGLQLANIIHEVMGTKQAGSIWKRPSTKIKGGDWYSVLYGAANVGTMGILLEHSYHTNLRSANWLLVDDNLKILADAEAKVISDYFGF